ncbi:rhamnogalacturonan acetylesterase [Segetibacter sp. 3557_3]|uniref:rhamnogalacturonan acetylesterase n=1 Tax=Segetibacter sp. 3557_3 TaxID=2547429 RepID=UPI0010583D60|nr:rhamnogalacturonan acetylesterase [Segetibacter sp. 3557_3]TDH26588.1 rhamnogalacturonan acetylesterase [Segetibacter sp. 3557_3]
MLLRFCLLLVSLNSFCVESQSVLKAPLKFRFGTGKEQAGYLTVNANTRYTPEKGYGIDRNTGIIDAAGFATSDKPFYFSVKLPEGNYDVKVTVGDKKGASDAAIRAECRRMMVNRIQTKAGESKTVHFTLHIRDSIIRGTNGSSKVRLKQREINYLHWDDKLTLEFNGEAPKVSAIEILPAAKDVITVFLAGNSTEVDQAEEPYTAWGQMIPAFFVPGKIAVANYAESGESLSSFISARRFEKQLSLMKAGDYAFVQFGHNDMKQKGPGIGAFTSYKRDLKYFIAEVKKKGGIPVLVTSMNRRSFDSTGKINHTLGDYPEAVRQTAKEEGVALIDLNAMSKVAYEAWGPVESIKAFVYFSAGDYPGATKDVKDDTHFSPFGAYEIAKLMVTGIRQNVPALAKLIKPGTPQFNPAKPGTLEAFYWPRSPSLASIKPDGN